MQFTGNCTSILISRKIEKVDATVESIQEQMDLANEIATAISAPLNTEMVDDNELLQELEDLEYQDIHEMFVDREERTASVVSGIKTMEPAEEDVPEVANDDDELLEMHAKMASSL